MKERNIVTLGLGWVISNDEVEEMREAAGCVWSEIEEYFMPIDPCADRTDYFLGFSMAPVEPGMALDLNKVAKTMSAEIDPNEFSNHFGHIISMCGREVGPESKWIEAQLYLISRFV